MEKITQLLSKYVMYAIYGIVVLLLVGNIRSCNTNKEVSKLRKDVDSLTTDIRTLNKSTYTQKQLDIRMSIEGYEISKRMLYDQNAIVRTTVRPDDRMNEYDSKIKDLTEKLK